MANCAAIMDNIISIITVAGKLYEREKTKRSET